MENDGFTPARPDRGAAADAVGEGPGEDVGESGEGHPGWVKTEAAAKMLGVSLRTIQQYVRRGELRALAEERGANKTYRVCVDSLKALRQRRRPDGYMSAEEAGRRWERGPEAVRYFCRRGVIPGARKGE